MKRMMKQERRENRKGKSRRNCASPSDLNIMRREEKRGWNIFRRSESYE
jgi:hypothetical protein